MHKSMACLGLIFASSPALAGENQWGGRVITQNQGYAEAGWPHVEGGVRLALAPGFELRPNLRVGFGGFGGWGFSLAPGVGARIQLFEDGDWAGALTLAVPIYLSFGAFGVPGAGLGVGIGLGHPGFMATYNIDQFDINFGIRFEDDLYFGGGPVFFMGSLPLVFGGEISVTDEVQLGLRAEVGPAFGTFGGWMGIGGGVGVGAMGRGLFTFGYSF